ncbi:MAG: EVE domain-containing protein [Chloroflexi bacterium]|nr:EVE domain-containing protein [Chloroflexota bacterium]MCH8869378.1 EVE domain-containing protein [Chloroflexota bacterium]MCH9040127.1 EVE domain-containing protein [Chloroflexota bacterium]MCI0791814.1 EVE domain-containing protein [Chloroflexota bacterium]MCI0796581.1 EVE domain-containing protein [Chloroflexota bacterium]
MARKRYWLIKSEPGAYSYADLQQEEDQTAEWDGIRSYTGRNYMRDEMKVGDGVLFYHSNAKPNAIVGTAIVVQEGYPDDTAWDPDSEHPDPKSTPDDPVWYMVDIKAETEFQRQVTLQEIRERKSLGDMVLVNNSRLSIQSVTGKEWRTILKMGMGES